MTQEEFKMALEAAYLAGFNASGEGYNAECPFDYHKESPANNRIWKVDRDNYIKEALAETEHEPVAIMREMLEVQGQHGNWNYDSYMHGLYNGMEYMVALAEKREPKFRNAPDEWLAKYEVKRDNFNSTDPLTEATSSPPEPDWKGLVLAHNEECESRCDKDRCGYARYFENNGRRCPTCPVYEKIDIDITPPQRKLLTNEQKYTLIEKHLGLKQRRNDTVIDQYTGLFYSAKPYLDLIDEAAHGIKD